MPSLGPPWFWVVSLKALHERQGAFADKTLTKQPTSLELLHGCQSAHPACRKRRQLACFETCLFIAYILNPFLVIFPSLFEDMNIWNFFGLHVKSAICVCSFCTNVLWYSLAPFWMGNIFLHDVKGFSMENRTKGYNLPIYLFNFSVLKIHISIESILWKVPTFLTKKLGKFCFSSLNSTKLAFGGWGREGNKAIFLLSHYWKKIHGYNLECDRITLNVCIKFFALFEGSIVLCHHKLDALKPSLTLPLDLGPSTNSV